MPLYKMDTIFKKGQKKKKIKKFLFLNKRRRWLKFPFIFKIYTPPPPTSRSAHSKLSFVHVTITKLLN